MDAETAAEQLKVIRQLMERPACYSTESGLSGVVAGAAALAGLALDWVLCRRYDLVTATWINIAVWAGVFVAAFAGATILTHLRERARGVPFWSSLRRPEAQDHPRHDRQGPSGPGAVRDRPSENPGPGEEVTVKGRAAP